MGENHSFYCGDDDLNRKIDVYKEEVFDGKSAMMRKALRLMFKEHQDELDALRNTEKEGPFT